MSSARWAGKASQYYINKMKKTFQDWIGSESFENGQRVETEFGELLKRRHPEAREATIDEQYMHIDWICDKGSIDVKAMKAVSRGSQLQDQYLWIEFRNKVGNRGWLYGTQDWVAFEYPNEYRIVPREALQALCEYICDVTDMVDRASDALYKGYTRHGMRDLLSLITTADLMTINPQQLPKDAVRDKVHQG